MNILHFTLLEDSKYGCARAIFATYALVVLGMERPSTLAVYLAFGARSLQPWQPQGDT